MSASLKPRKAGAASGAKKRTFSPETLAVMKEKAQQRGKARAEAVIAKVRQAMQALGEEMQGRKDGLLPDGRKLTEALLYERAGIAPNTIANNPETYGRFHDEIKAWITAFTEEKPAATPSQRRSPEERGEAWRQLYERLQQKFQLVELELQHVERERNLALQRAEKAEQEKAVLERALREAQAAKVKPFPTRKD